MANKNNQIGVITEQGFVMGNNLGFKPVNENLDLDKKSKKEKEENKFNKEKKETK